MINSLSTSLPIAPLVINHPLKANLTCNGRWLTRMELVKPFFINQESAYSPGLNNFKRHKRLFKNYYK